MKNKYYNGKTIDSHKTAIKNYSSSPGVRFLKDNGYIPDKSFILDFGAGKYPRNANYLRSLGHTVYAYDPLNGEDIDGLSNKVMGISSSILPTYLFDIIITSYVLNVVPLYEEQNINNLLKTFTVSINNNIYHIVRNDDIIKLAETALQREDDNLIKGFFYKVYHGSIISTSTIIDFCKFGFQTLRGFQRLVCNNSQYETIKDTSNYKIYKVK